ncbi:Scarecrow-like protein 18 [Platanthera guangdongensis]|uniref:Scarecrow-like protein 18 n=1 Tax=Platanthera guangdongensis TaxID=2320717 RepID=A0ABR2MFR0_9ASPA
MLSSLKSHEEGEEEHHHHHHHNHRRRHQHHLLLRCAELIDRLDLPAARRAISLLSASSSPFGDSADRITNQFTHALSLRLDRLSLVPSLSPTDSDSGAQSAYLSLNKITPFLRFPHLTANQAILDAIDIHILDFDTSHGLQWPPFLQAVAERSDPNNPPSIRITGTGSDLSVLRRTALRLHSFATSLRDARAFLRSVRALNPAVVTLAEREASHGSPSFLERLPEAVEHYTALFESLEATLPPTSRERMEVERVWFGKEIAGVVAGEERHERFVRWEEMMSAAGFEAAPLSAFAVSQARLLLRLHYPAEGYRVQVLRGGSCFLGWQSNPLFSVSSWHCN